ncbi:hypothetical protein V8C40DRAFT_53032 [Trichoderma camerunense]
MFLCAWFFSADTYKFGSETMAFFYLPVYLSFFFCLLSGWHDWTWLGVLSLYFLRFRYYLFGGIMASLDGLLFRLADIFN